MERKKKINEFLNQYIVEDNTKFLDSIDNDCVDLIYIDPPFFSNRDFDDFNDKWFDREEYNLFIEKIILKLYEKMKNSSVIIVHCDISGSHYIKAILDKIFLDNNFINEIIWKTTGNRKSKNKLQRAHDTLFVYSKSKKYTFNQIYKEYDKNYKIKNNIKFCEIHKMNYVTTALHNSQPNVIKRENLRYDWNGHFLQWYVSLEKMKKLHNDNRLIYNKKGIPRIKRFLEEMSGIPLRDVWDDISSIQSNEKCDYATQKPIKLLDRLISLFSNENDIVLDVFAGSGTTGRSCIKFKRNFILVDKNSKGKLIFENSLKK